MILWFAKCLLNTHHVPDSVLGAHGTVASRTPFVEHLRYRYRTDEWVKFVLCCSVKFGRLQGRQGGLGTRTMRGDFRKAFFAEKGLLSRHWWQRRNPVGRSVMGEVAEILGCKHDRFVWTGVKWGESADGRMFIHASSGYTLLLMRWKGTVVGSGGETCSACSLGLLSLECSGVGQGIYRGKQSIPGQRSPTEVRWRWQRPQGWDSDRTAWYCRSQKSCSRSEKPAWAEQPMG